MSAAELEIIVTANTGDAVAGLNAAGDAVNELANRVSQFVVGHALEDIGKSLIDFAGNAVKTGAEFGQEIDFVNKLAGGSADTLQMLNDKALEMGQSTIFSAQEAAQGMEQLAREGFTPLQIVGTNAMNSLIEGAANMAAALRIDLPDAANMMGTTIRAFADQNLTAAQASDTLTQAVLRSGKSAAEFQTAWQFVSAQADLLHIPFEQMAAAVSMLMSQGIGVSQVGTGLRTLLTNIMVDGSPASNELAKLGISATDAQGGFIGLIPLLTQLHDAFLKMSPAQQEDAVKALAGGLRANSAVLKLIQDGPDMLNAFIDKMHSLGSAASVMGTLVDTLAGSFHMLSSSWFTLQKVMGDSVGGVVKPFVDGLVGLVNAAIGLPTPILAAAMGVIAFAGALAYASGAFLIFNALGGFAILGSMATVMAVGFGIAVVAAAGLAFGLGLLAPKIETFLKFYRELTSAHDLGFQKIPGLDALDAGLEALGLTFPSLSGATDFLRGKIDFLGQSFDAWRRVGVDPFNAAMKALMATFPGLEGPIQDLQNAGDDLAVGFGQGGVLGVFQALPTAFKDAGLAVISLGDIILDNLVAGIQSTNWSAVANTIVSGIGNAISAAASGGVRLANWTLNVAVPAVIDGLEAAGSWIGSKLSTVAAAVSGFSAWALHVVMPAILDGLQAAGQWIGAKLAAVAVAVSGFSAWAWHVATPAVLDGLENAGQWIGAKLRAAAVAVAGFSAWALHVVLPAVLDGLQAAGQWIGSKLVAAKAAVDGFSAWALHVAAPTVLDGLERAGDWIFGKLSSLHLSPSAITDWILTVGLPTTISGLDRAADWLYGKLASLKISPSAITDWILTVGIPTTISGLDAAHTWIEDKLEGHVTVDLSGWTLNLKAPDGGVQLDASFDLGKWVSDNLAQVTVPSFGKWALVLANPQSAALVAGVDLGAKIKASLPHVTASNFTDWAISLLPPGVGELATFAQGFSAGQLGQDIGTDIGHVTVNITDWSVNLVGNLFDHIVFGGSSSDAGGGSTTGATGPTGTQLSPAQQAALNDKVNREIAQGNPYAPPPTDNPMGMDYGFNDNQPYANTNYTPPTTYGSGAQPGRPGGVYGNSGGSGHGFAQQNINQAQDASSFIPPDLTAQFQAAGQKAGQAFATALGAGLQTALTAVTAVMSGISAVVSSRSAAFSTAGTTAGRGFATALGAGMQLALTMVTVVTAAIGTIATTVGTRLIAVGTTAGHGFATALGTGMQLALTMVTAVTTAITTIAQAGLTRLTTLAQTSGQQFATSLGAGMQLALTMLTAVMAAMTAVTTAWSASTVALGTTTGSGFATGLGAGLQLALSATVATAAAMTGILTAFAAAAGAAGQTAGTQFAYGLGAGLQQALSAAAATASAIVAVLDSAASGAYSAGLSIGEGLASGMDASAGAVAAAAANLASIAASATAAALGINSPSRVFAELGHGIGEGLVLGMRQQHPDVATAGVQIAQSAIPSPATLRGMQGGGGFSLAPTSGPRTINVTLQFQGDTYGVDEFDARVADAATTHLVPAIVDAMALNDRTMGVRR